MEKISSLFYPSKSYLVIIFGLIGVIGISGISQQAFSANESISISVDPRVELISIVFHLAGHREYNQSPLSSYIKDIDNHFAHVKSHPAVTLARELDKRSGIHLNAPMSIAPYIDGKFQPRKSLDEWPWEIDSRWKKEDVGLFIKYLQDFAKKSQFHKFIENHRSLYKIMVEQMQEKVEKCGLEIWLDHFFGIKSGAQLNLIVSLVNGPNNYATRFNRGDSKECYSIVGITYKDESGLPVITGDKMHIAAHEFSHCFVNPIIDKHLQKFEEAGKRIYPQFKAALERESYGHWEAMIYESIARACEADFLKTCVSEEKLNEFLKYEKRKGAFIWLEQMVKLLDKYDSNRDKYLIFESFLPEFIKFFDSYNQDPYDFPIAVNYKKSTTVCKDTTIDVKVDPRIELICIIFGLAGNKEYNDCKVSVYKKIVQDYFAPYKDHPTVQFARKIEKEAGIHMDAPISMALQLDEHFQPRKSFDEWPWGIDKRWTKEDAKLFFEHLDHFVKDTEFNQFIENNRALYHILEEPYKKFLAKNELESWYYDFFGNYPDAKINLTIAPLIGITTYTGAFEKGSSKERYMVIGIHFTDSQGVPGTQDRWVGWISEQLMVAYAEPLVSKYIKRLYINNESKKHLHLLSGTWNDRVRQYTIMASIAYYIKTHMGESLSKDFLNYYMYRGYVELDKATDIIVKNHEKHNGFDSYYVEFCKFLDGE